MAEVKGKLVTCDRCGAQVFLKTTGDGEADGGYTRWNKFEPFPDGWDYVQTARIEPRSSEYSRLCPECTKEWEYLMDIFMGRLTDGEK